MQGGQDDKGLTEEDLLDSFHFKDSREALSLLKDMPRKIASDWISKIPRVREKHEEILNVIDEGSAETLKQLVENKLKSGEISSDELSTITKMAFIKVIYKFCHTDSFILKSNTKDVKDKVKFFLDLKVDGKPIMQEEDILSACVSDQKDVREAIKEYQKEHPDDKRFPENNGLLGATIGKGKRFAYMMNELNRKRALNKQDKSLSQNQADFIHRGIKDDPEDVKNFIKLNLRRHHDRILKAIEIEFTRFVEKDASNEYIQNSKDMLKFFLDLEVDGKPVMQEKDITKLFKNARISGRKDVEEAMLEYKAEHPEDKRFSEKMFEFNRRDKVAEFVKRQERKAAKVKFAVENAAKKAANKGASTLTVAEAAKGR